MAEQWLLEDGTPWLLEDGTFQYLETADGAGPPVVIPDMPGLPPVPTWSLDLCRHWVRIAEADAFAFNGVERFNKPGEWSVELPPAAISEWSITGVLDEDGAMGVYGPGDVDSVILWRDDEIAFPGMVAKVSEGVGASDYTRDGGRETLRWSGPDLWGILHQALAFPNPAVDATSADPTPWAVTHDVRTGRASTVLAGIIQDNLSAIALLSDRRYPGLTVDDRIAGVTDQFSVRLQYLDEVATRLATDGQFRCRLVLDDDLTVTIVLDTPTDLSSSVVISDQGDLSKVALRRVPRSADWVLAGGQGEGVARQFQVAAGSPPFGRRVEVFNDQSSLSTLAELLRSAQSVLRFGAATWSIDAEVTDNLARSLRYGRDLRVGDVLTVEVGGARYPVPIVSAVFEVSSARQVVRPQLGTGVPDELRGLLRDVSNLAARLDRSIA